MSATANIKRYATAKTVNGLICPPAPDPPTDPAVAIIYNIGECAYLYLT